MIPGCSLNINSWQLSDISKVNGHVLSKQYFHSTENTYRKNIISKVVLTISICNASVLIIPITGIFIGYIGYIGYRSVTKICPYGTKLTASTFSQCLVKQAISNKSHYISEEEWSCMYIHTLYVKCLQNVLVNSWRHQLCVTHIT